MGRLRACHPSTTAAPAIRCSYPHHLYSTYLHTALGFLCFGVPLHCCSPILPTTCHLRASATACPNHHCACHALPRNHLPSTTCYYHLIPAPPVPCPSLPTTLPSCFSFLAARLPTLHILLLPAFPPLPPAPYLLPYLQFTFSGSSQTCTFYAGRF